MASAGATPSHELIAAADCDEATQADAAHAQRVAASNAAAAARQLGSRPMTAAERQQRARGAGTEAEQQARRDADTQRGQRSRLAAREAAREAAAARRQMEEADDARFADELPPLLKLKRNEVIVTPL